MEVPLVSPEIPLLPQLRLSIVGHFKTIAKLAGSTRASNASSALFFERSANATLRRPDAPRVRPRAFSKNKNDGGELYEGDSAHPEASQRRLLEQRQQQQQVETASMAVTGRDGENSPIQVVQRKRCRGRLTAPRSIYLSIYRVSVYPSTVQRSAMEWKVCKVC